VYDNNIIGAIFCQVNKIRLLIQSIPSIISGNQKWKGAAPIFNNNDELIIISINILISKISLIKLFNIIIIKIENKKIVEANAWIKKYLIEDSVEYELFFFFNRGINDNKLISKPIQVPIQV